MNPKPSKRRKPKFSDMTRYESESDMGFDWWIKEFKNLPGYYEAFKAGFDFARRKKP